MAAQNPALPPDFPRAEEKFRQALREANLNDTAQRRHVLHVFLRATEPVTQDQLQHLAIGADPFGRSLGLVSGVLKIMLAAGLAAELEPLVPGQCPACGGPSIILGAYGTGSRLRWRHWHCNQCRVSGYAGPRFTPVRTPCAHAHVVCRDCGAVLSP